MSHRIGTVRSQSPATLVGVGQGVEVSPGRWKVVFSPPSAPTGTKFLFLHFTGATFGAGDRLEIPLGYDTDVFTNASGSSFWSRPVKGNSVEIFFVDGGSGTGQASLGEFGRGEGLLNGGTNASAGGIANGDVFMIATPWVEPTYFNPAGVCPSGTEPSWENVATLPPGVMRETARSVGMFIEASEGNVSTCSATLIAPDLILTAGHCVGANNEAVVTGSFTLDFQTDAGGNRPTGYNARFFKLKRLVKTGFAVSGVGAGVSTGTNLDYAVIQIETPPGGLGVAPLTIRASQPAVGEELFVIHHPRATVKKVSRKPTDPTCQVLSAAGGTITYACDSDNGSSGSSVFDATGQIVAVNDWAPGACSNQGQSAAAILADFTNPAPAFQDVDAMLVLDRSGSMSALGFTGVQTKLEEAKKAAALFVDLLRTDRTHQVGLATFSTSASLDFPLAAASPASKDNLIGPAPNRDAGVVGGITAGGSTTIGGGLQTGQGALPAPGTSSNLPAILLLTDGLENTPPLIADVEASLGGTRLCIVGFGSEASVDGPRLTSLARTHGGIYTRAGEGLQLKKFFVLAFGNIFETAVAMDPVSVLPEGATRVAPIPLSVCGEERLTAVLSWEHDSESLELELVSPGGSTITGTTPGVTSSSGSTWTYLRLLLPLSGERDGTWQVQVSRPGGGGEFPPPLPEERFFVTVTVEGGPYFRAVGPRRYYTGDTINPLVVLRQPSGFTVHGKVMVDIELPQEGTGNILTQAGLLAPGEVGGDQMDARVATLVSLEAERGSLIPTASRTFELSGEGEENGTGSLEPDGVYGMPLQDIARFEGNYTFHARAVYGEECTGTREATWSLYVAVGIDPDNTQVSTEPTGTLPDGRECLRFRFTPRDRYGNHLGPGRLDVFEVQPGPGTTLESAVRDLGNGSYEVDICWDLNTADTPTVGVAQPERPPVVIGPAAKRRFVYSVKFLCGEQRDDCAGCGPVRPGSYATEINVFNPQQREVGIIKRIVPLVLAGAPRAREPGVAAPTTVEKLLLPPHSATMDDCCRILELLLGAPPAAPVPITVGILEITTPVELSVTAVYTVTHSDNGSTAIDVRTVEAIVT